MIWAVFGPKRGNISTVSGFGRLPVSGSAHRANYRTRSLAVRSSRAQPALPLSRSRARSLTVEKFGQKRPFWPILREFLDSERYR